VLAVCRSWFVADISEDHTAIIIRAEVRKVRKYYTGVGDGSGHRNWPIRARYEGSIENNTFWS
jgi:hypothetical protein